MIVVVNDDDTIVSVYAAETLNRFPVLPRIARLEPI